MSLYLEQTAGTSRLKVEQSSYQYQTKDHREIFRYDYLRRTKDVHPSAHLNVHGMLDVADELPAKRPLSRIHFPTGRISLEAVIRCLVDQFGVPAREPADVWRAVLAESEARFEEIAHRPLSGPDH